MSYVYVYFRISWGLKQCLPKAGIEAGKDATKIMYSPTTFLERALGFNNGAVELRWNCAGRGGGISMASEKSMSNHFPV